MNVKMTPEVQEYKKQLASIGGKARAAKLSARRRSQIARKAANALWEKRKGDHA